EKLPDFVARHCHETSATEQASICKIVAKYNGHYPNQPLLANECLMIPDNLKQQLKRKRPQVNIGPRFAGQEARVLNQLLKQYNGDEIMAISTLVDTLPQNDDTLKAFAGGLLGASRACGKGYIQALQVYNDSLVEWKNASKKQRNKIKIDKVQPAHEKLSKVYKSEVSSMARSNVVLKSTKRGMRALRSRKHSIDLTNTSDVQRLKRFLKIARVSAVGAIVIDATFAGQKVKNADAAGENSEKVAYEEYGALIGGIALAGALAIFLTQD
ncbi:MAG: hypothetical protein L3J89_15225, partial [Gammaproteobacteria bacterium]|nr:hypothetical protein [Gammaproteobacteria bacterium]